MRDYNRSVIDLLKSYIAGKEAETDAILRELGIEIDRRIINKEDTKEVSELYNDILWLKSEIL